MKEYLGDSVYAEYDGYNIILTTENGLPDDPSNRIVLEPGLLQNLVKFYELALEALTPLETKHDRRNNQNLPRL